MTPVDRYPSHRPSHGTSFAVGQYSQKKLSPREKIWYTHKNRKNFCEGATRREKHRLYKKKDKAVHAGGSQLEDKTIIDLYWARNRDAIVESENKYGSWCRTLSVRILGSLEDAEECVNDTWLRAWNAMPPNRPARLSLFLGKITRNLSLDRLKSRSREKRGGGTGEVALEELQEMLSGGQSPQEVLEDREIIQSLNRWLRSLTQEKRAVFLLRYWQMESVMAIARRLGVSESKITSQLHRLRKNLRIYLEKEGIPL